jgi:hypothetical protein
MMPRTRDQRARRRFVPVHNVNTTARHQNNIAADMTTNSNDSVR